MTAWRKADVGPMTASDPNRTLAGTDAAAPNLVIIWPSLGNVWQHPNSASARMER